MRNTSQPLLPEDHGGGDNGSPSEDGGRAPGFNGCGGQVARVAPHCGFGLTGTGTPALANIWFPNIWFPNIWFPGGGIATGGAEGVVNPVTSAPSRKSIGTPTSNAPAHSSTPASTL